jgi:hypothetical protein
VDTDVAPESLRPRLVVPVLHGQLIVLLPRTRVQCKSLVDRAVVRNVTRNRAVLVGAGWMVDLAVIGEEGIERLRLIDITDGRTVTTGDIRVGLLCKTRIHGADRCEDRRR